MVFDEDEEASPSKVYAEDDDPSFDDSQDYLNKSSQSIDSESTPTSAQS
jgi:hypothetical protein